jgi:chorismate mutase
VPDWQSLFAVGCAARGIVGMRGGTMTDHTSAPRDVTAEHDTGQDAEATATLGRLRGTIDNIDAALVYMLAERFRATKQVGRLKAEHGMPASDPAREEQQLARLRSLAIDADLDPEFAQKWFSFVVAEVIRHHVEAAEEH